MKYQILVECSFFDSWIKRFTQWRKQSKQEGFNQDVEFLSSLVENLILTMEKNKVVVSKYNNVDFEVYNGYINYLKNQIFKLLPLIEEGGEWRKHLDTIITEITGVDKIFLHTISFITLLGKLETLKDCPNFPASMSKKEIQARPEYTLFRKTVFESINVAENLTLAGDHSEE